MLQARLATTHMSEQAQRDKLLRALRRCERHLADGDFTEASLAALKADVARILSRPISEPRAARPAKAMLPVVRAWSGVASGSGAFMSSARRIAPADKTDTLGSAAAREARRRAGWDKRRAEREAADRAREAAREAERLARERREYRPPAHLLEEHRARVARTGLAGRHPADLPGHQLEAFARLAVTDFSRIAADDDRAAREDAERRRQARAAAAARQRALLDGQLAELAAAERAEREERAREQREMDATLERVRGDEANEGVERRRRQEALAAEHDRLRAEREAAARDARERQRFEDWLEEEEAKR